MTKKHFGVFAVAALLLAALYFVAVSGYEARKQPPKPAGETVVQPTTPVAPAPDKAAGPANPVGERPAGQMELAPAARNARAADSAEAAAGVSYSLKKEGDRQLVPGVTYSADNRSFNIQLANKDETIQLKRAGDAVGDYQVMWRKKY